MLIRLGMETGIEGRSLAWGLDFPGCFSYGQDDAEALLLFPQTLIRYADWVGLHTPSPWFEISNMDLRIEERFVVYCLQNGEKIYEVNAFFKDDERLLTSQEVDHALLLYSWQRDELLAGIETLPEEVLHKQYPGERWDIFGILRHIAKSEYWYLGNLYYELTPLPDTPGDPLRMLQLAESQVRKYLPTFTGNPTHTNKQGEEWSCRKAVRSLLWHQRDHIDHIKKLAFRQD